MRASISSLAGASALLLLTACSSGGGGSSTPPPSYATSLSYTNPTSGQYQLVKDPASSGGTLVLDLVGPAGATISGVSFSANADTGKVTWAAAIQNGNTFTPVVAGGKSSLVTKISGQELQGAVSQRVTDATAPLTAASVLAKVTMTLNGRVTPGAVTFADGGKGTVLIPTGSVTAIPVSVGQLNAQ